MYRLTKKLEHLGILHGLLGASHIRQNTIGILDDSRDIFPIPAGSVLLSVLGKLLIELPQVPPHLSRSVKTEFPANRSIVHLPLLLFCLLGPLFIFCITVHRTFLASPWQLSRIKRSQDMVSGFRAINYIDILRMHLKPPPPPRVGGCFLLPFLLPGIFTLQVFHFDNSHSESVAQLLFSNFISGCP